ncbi:MAG: type II toxin-antitoxin system Phd/YefM family antitoxin [Oscillospiraceae bacterium]|nr:type II toxin-antitoxin system Phd/YefM family antitoxin [Oscillospiraceae bacterium]
MVNVASAIRDTVPISSFNRGLAGRIFEEVKKNGAKVVIKNNSAECVLLSPDEYIRMSDELHDARMLAVSLERLTRYNPSETVSWHDMNARLGIDENDLTGWEDIDLE